jgi:hypothetical protein
MMQERLCRLSRFAEADWRTMTTAKHNRKLSTVRSFERAGRIQALIDAGIIRSASEIPADAIPARPEFVERCRQSLRAQERPPYYRDRPFTCTDCKRTFTWTAEEQRFWYEQFHGSIYSEAARCRECRKQRKKRSTA